MDPEYKNLEEGENRCISHIRGIKLTEREILSWPKVYQKYNDMFCEATERCVLIQNIPENVTESELRHYFQANNLCREYIKRVLPIKDGVLVEFKDEQDAKNVMTKKLPKFRGNHLRIFSKPLPCAYNDRFVVQGKFANSELLTTILERYEENPLFTVEKNFFHSENYLVKFMTEFDIKKMRQHFAHVDLDVSPKVCELLRTDCILVRNMNNTVTNDDIKITFLNKSKTNGGDVTHVERKSSSEAMVYFADHRDAENVGKKYNKSKLDINGVKVIVSLYYGQKLITPNLKSAFIALSQSLIKKLPPLEQFHYKPSVDKDILECISISPDTIQDLQKEFSHLGKVEIRNLELCGSEPSKYVVVFKPLQKQDMTKHYPKKQKEFNNACVKLMDIFLDSFCAVSCQLNEEKLWEIRKDCFWNEEKRFIDINASDIGNCRVYVKWNDTGVPGMTKAVGRKDQVTFACDWLQRTCNVTVLTEKFSDLDFKIIKECRLIEDVLYQTAVEVSIQLQHGSTCLVLKGQTDNVNSALADFNTARSKVQSVSLPFLDKHDFMTEATEEGKDYLYSHVKLQFRSRNIRAFLSLTSKTMLFYRRHRDLTEAKKVLHDLLITRKMFVKREFELLIQSDDWKEFEQHILSERLCLRKDRMFNALILSGLAEPVNEAYKLIRERISSNLVEKRIVELHILYVELLINFPKECKADINLKDVEWHRTYENTGQICLEGVDLDVAAAETWLKQGNASVAISSKIITKPGISRFFSGQSGKDFLQSTQLLTKCIITSESLCKEANSTKPSLIPVLDHFPPEVLITKGDISKIEADVIVTCTLPGEFASASGSVTTRALLKEAGEELQRECQELAKTHSLQPGEVVATGGYNLKCKMVYQILLEKYNVLELTKINHLSTGIAMCLAMAASENYTSIAFPALGTGGMHYPTKEVAVWIKKSLEDFKSTSLRKVDVVLFPTDENTIKAFSEVFNIQKIDYIKTAAPIRRPLSSIIGNISPLKISVRQGDILAHPCEVIFNSVTGVSEFIGGQLSVSMLNKGGQSIADQWKSNPIASTKSCRVTNSGNLSCIYIAHIVCPKTASELTQILIDVLELIDGTLNCSTVAVPAIATGNAGFDSKDVADSMRKAFQHFRNSNPKRVKVIDVIILQSEIVDVFQAAIEPEMTSQKKTTKDKPIIAPKPLWQIPCIVGDLLGDKLSIRLCAKNETNVDEAWKRISDKIDEQSTRREIDMGNIVLGKEEAKEILGLEKKHNVMIRRHQITRELMKLIIVGANEDVLKASEAIQAYKEAFTLAEFVIWKYENDEKCLMNFSVRTSLEIERLHKNDDLGRFNIKEPMDGNEFVVDFDKMTKSSLQGDDATTIVRSKKVLEEVYPSTWTHMGSDSWKNVIVPPTSQEYQNVLKTFNETGIILNPIELQRIQNPRLYKQFVEQKRYVEEKMKQRGKLTDLPVSRELFHGTSQDVCEIISKDGFDRSHCGKNATKFGEGVYFSTTSRFSKVFAIVDKNGNHWMFLAEVLTGEYHVGKQGLRTPNYLDEKQVEKYDSVVNKLISPDLFVVFKDASAYPTYMLKYKQ